MVSTNNVTFFYWIQMQMLRGLFANSFFGCLHVALSINERQRQARSKELTPNNYYFDFSIIIIIIIIIIIYESLRLLFDWSHLA